MARNIELMRRLEEESLRERSAAQRAADAIADFAGSLTFVVIQVVVFGLWILGNLGLVPLFPVFDPYPFMLLAMTVSLEAIFLSTFVLIKQNRMSLRADQRARLNLQITLLAEREMTLVLQLLSRMSTRLGVRMPQVDVEELSQETPVEALATELREKLPGE